MRKDGKAKLEDRSNAEDDLALEEAVTDCLEESGVLGKVRAQVRLEVMRAVKGQEKKANRAQEKEASFDGRGDNFLLEELIREYLEWNGLEATKEVLALETERPVKVETLSRDRMEEGLGVKVGSNAQRVPLLYSLLAMARKNKA